MLSKALTSGVTIIVLCCSAGFAQEAPDAGAASTPEGEAAVGAVEAPEAQSEEEVTIGESAILPSAEDHEASRAPTMALDCDVRPEECLGEPLTTPAEGPAVSTTPAPDAGAGAPLVAEP